LELQRIEQGQPSDYINVSQLKIRKSNGTRRLFGFVETTKTITEDLMIEANAFVKRGNQYQLLPFKYRPESVCLYMKKDPYGFVKEIKEKSNFTTSTTCDFEPVSKQS
jgi:hypothetical protein